MAGRRAAPRQSVDWRRHQLERRGLREPPKRSKLVLSAQVLATLRRWIEGGAATSRMGVRHGAGEAVAVPRFRDRGVAAQRDRPASARAPRATRGLRPTPEARPGLWLRADMLRPDGLPARRPRKLSAVVADGPRRAREGRRAALLAVARFGERMAVHGSTRRATPTATATSLTSCPRTWPFSGDWVVRRSTPASRTTASSCGSSPATSSRAPTARRARDPRSTAMHGQDQLRSGCISGSSSPSTPRTASPRSAAGSG
jgi:hypothetical protein